MNIRFFPVQLLAIVLSSGFLTSQALADEGSGSKVSASGKFVTMGHYRTDSDFDPAERFDDLDGQSDAQIATVFAPKLTMDTGAGLTVVYELELGWNAWGRNDPGAPNQFLSANAPGLAARHKQAYAQWDPSGKGDALVLRAGYQKYKDPTGLFLDREAGLVAVDFKTGALVVKALAGQLPDSTYEGVSIREDNFATDSFVAGLGVSHGTKTLEVSIMAFGVTDERNIGRPLQLFTGAAAVESRGESLSFWIHGVSQMGTWSHSGVGGVDQSIGAWAAQMGLSYRVGGMDVTANAFALSGDDDFDGNDTFGAFLGSGKNASRSVFLTEDETRDRYDNLDERMGSAWGPFATNRAGLMVAELSAGLEVTKTWGARLVAAHGRVLNAVNAFGEDTVGTEIALLQGITLGKGASLFLDGFVFLPGGAAAAKVNDINRSATETLFGVAMGLSAEF